MRAVRMTIGEVARRAGVGVETVRFYERKGLIGQPAKPIVGYREYPARTVGDIVFIRQAQDLGFSLREIGELMELQADAAADCGDVRDRCAAKIEDVRSKIDRLQRMEAALMRLVTACPGRGRLRDCTIMRSLADPVSSESGDDAERVEWTIDGMHCGNCARRLTGLLSQRPGVRKAAVSLERRRAEIVFDPASESPAALRALIEAAGFSPRAD